MYSILLGDFMFCKDCNRSDQECKINRTKKQCYSCIRKRKEEIAELKSKGLWNGRDNSYLKDKPAPNRKSEYKTEEGIDYKKCPCCSLWKSYSEYNKASKNKDGLSTFCKLCKSQKDSMSYERNKDKRKETNKKWYESNKERMSEYNRERLKDETVAKRTKEKQAEWRLLNREYNLLKKKEYYEKNKIAIFEQMKEKKRNDPNARLKANLRSRVSMAVKGILKSARTLELLGCSFEEFKSHLESKFLPGMTWDNYGKDGWEADHILPCDSFDLTDPEQQKVCFNYKNIQPLWHNQNRRKSNRLDWTLDTTTPE